MSTVSMPEGVGEVLRRLQWRQGAALPRSLFPDVQMDHGGPPREEEVAIVLTADCNVLHHDLNGEPVAEVLLARRLPATSSTYTNLRNPRILHLATQGGGALEFRAARHGSILRDRLTTISPDAAICLDEQARRLMARWWSGGRFLRSSFPDEFNRRLTGSGRSRELERLLKSNSAHVIGVFLRVHPDSELPEGEQYAVILRAVVSRRSGDDEQILAMLDENFYSKLVALFDNAQGLVLLDHELVSERDFSFEDYQLMQRLEYDHLSYSGASGNTSSPLARRD